MSEQPHLLEKYKATIKCQIKLEFYTAYIYFTMATYFDQDSVDLKHFAQYFRQEFLKQRAHVETLMRLQNKRGSRLQLQNIRKPSRDRWNTGLKAMEYTLYLKKCVNHNLLHLYQLASKMKDASLCEFLDHRYLREQSVVIKELRENVTTLRKLGALESRLEEYLFDQLALGNTNKK